LFVTSTPDASNNQGTVEVAVLENSNLFAYPNPARETIAFNRPITGKMMTCTGTIVDTLNHALLLNVQHYAPGMYLLQTTDGDILRILVQ
jgi:hypothetical protein